MLSGVLPGDARAGAGAGAGGDEDDDEDEGVGEGPGGAGVSGVRPAVGPVWLDGDEERPGAGGDAAEDGPALGAGTGER